MLKTIFVYATSVCNHECRHCYLGYEGSWEPKKLYEFVKNMKSKKYQVIINGAEVLTNILYLDSFKLAEQNFIFTNGKIFTSDQKDKVLCKILESGITSVKISHHFDSIESLGSVDSETVETAIDYLISHGISVEINTTITKDNFRQVEEICDFCIKKYSQSKVFFVE